MDEADDPTASVSSLPATMADIFLALVAVVIMMLLALVPAIRMPGALTAPPPFDLWRSTLTIEEMPATTIIAEAEGLRLTVPSERLVALGNILDDSELAQGIKQASAGPNPLLLVIQPDGQEAAFLFEALASSLGVEAVHQLRVDAGCSYVADARLAAECARRPPSVPAR